MTWQEWGMLIGFVLLMGHDLYCFIFRKKIEDRSYRRTVEDVNWNRDVGNKDD